MGVSRLTTVQMDEIVRAALQEDAGGGDITTDLLLSENDPDTSAVIQAKEPLVLSGSRLAARVFEILEPEIEVTLQAIDGEKLSPGQTVANIQGRASTLLIGERTALNFLGRMSGIATLTARYREAMGESSAKLLCTRKTTPLFRAMELHAVQSGGGILHRRSLHDGVLLKDNHLLVAGGVKASIAQVRRGLGPAKTIECEVQNLEELEQAIEAGADVVLLDNFTPDGLREAVAKTAGRVRLEASGGVNLETIGEIAATGVDAVSVGALTHSAVCADLNMTVFASGV